MDTCTASLSLLFVLYPRHRSELDPVATGSAFRSIQHHRSVNIASTGFRWIFLMSARVLGVPQRAQQSFHEVAVDRRRDVSAIKG